MRIVQVIDQLGLGGAERVCVNLTNLLFRNGNEVKLIVLNDEGALFDLIDDGVEVVRLHKNKGKFKAYKAFKKHIKKDDIIHIHMRSPYRFVRKAFLFLGGNRPVILHDHYGKIVVNQSVPKWYKSVFKPHFFIGCSELLTKWAVQKVGLKQDRVFLVNNFVLHYESNYKNHTPKGLVLVGSLKKVKNHSLAMDIAKALDKDLTIYCPSLEGGEGDYYETLVAHMEKINYKDRIHFVTGCNNVQTELKQYEMALLTSTSEGDPLALVEYMAQGLPFLCSDIGESVKVVKKYYPDMVQTDFNLDNWVANYHKVKEIQSEQIESLYNEHFSSDVYLEKYLAIYKKFLASV